MDQEYHGNWLVANGHLDKLNCHEIVINHSIWSQTHLTFSEESEWQIIRILNNSAQRAYVCICVCCVLFMLQWNMSW